MLPSWFYKPYFFSILHNMTLFIPLLHILTVLFTHFCTSWQCYFDFAHHANSTFYILHIMTVFFTYCTSWQYFSHYAHHDSTFCHVVHYPVILCYGLLHYTHHTVLSVTLCVTVSYYTTSYYTLHIMTFDCHVVHYTCHDVHKHIPNFYFTCAHHSLVNPL